MTDSQRAKVVLVELVRLDVNGKEALGQLPYRKWLCTASSPVLLIDFAHDFDLDENTDLEYDLSHDGSQIDQDFRQSLEDQIYSFLRIASVVDAVQGIEVVELVFHTKSGPVFNSSKGRFLVIQRGKHSATYICDSFEDAYGVALKESLMGKDSYEPSGARLALAPKALSPNR